MRLLPFRLTSCAPRGIAHRLPAAAVMISGGRNSANDRSSRAAVAAAPLALAAVTTAIAGKEAAPALSACSGGDFAGFRGCTSTDTTCCRLRLIETLRRRRLT